MRKLKQVWSESKGNLEILSQKKLRRRYKKCKKSTNIKKISKIVNAKIYCKLDQNIDTLIYKDAM